MIGIDHPVVSNVRKPSRDFPMISSILIGNSGEAGISYDPLNWIITPSLYQQRWKSIRESLDGITSGEVPQVR